MLVIAQCLKIKLSTMKRIPRRRLRRSANEAPTHARRIGYVAVVWRNHRPIVKNFIMLISHQDHRGRPTNRALQVFIFSILFSLSALDAAAKDIYRLVGMAPLDGANALVTRNLDLPIDPASSSAITRDGGNFILHKYGTLYSTNFTCSMAGSEYSKHEYPRDFYRLNIFENQIGLDHFLRRKFHSSSKGWTNFYILGNSTSPACATLRYSTLHASSNELVLVQLPYVYLFAKQIDAFAGSEKALTAKRQKQTLNI
ncbi:hypothetical protein PQQ52_05870 [Paraburkholderia sediminicola]|uniref:hypothetical protein n=1 Tax=Paraburkholderia sediminicola TaxID=458836 RepID=UPI0038B7AFCF